MKLVNEEMASIIYNVAESRGQYKGVNKKDIILKTLKHIRKEVREAEKALDVFLDEYVRFSSTYNPNRFESEIIDILFICVSLCWALGIDINAEAENKLNYNITRKD